MEDDLNRIAQLTGWMIAAAVSTLLARSSPIASQSCI
jgi:hypothetical protein